MIIILGMLFTQSCKTTKDFSKMTKDDIKVKMSKGACYGSCPVYELSIYDGGYAHFHGKRYTSKDGKWLKKLDKNTYKELISQFEKSNFSSFQNEYESELADLQSVKISYDNKSVVGKDGRPEKLLALQKYLDDIVNSKNGWTQLEKPKIDKRAKKIVKKPKYDYSQILLEPKQGHSLVRILSKYKKEFGLRLLKKISSQGNLWLLTYDMENNDPNEILKRLKKDDGVKSVSYNLLTSER